MSMLAKMVFGPIHDLESVIINNIESCWFMFANTMIVLLVLSIYIPILSMMICVCFSTIKVMIETGIKQSSVRITMLTGGVSLGMLYMFPLFGSITICVTLLKCVEGKPPYPVAYYRVD